MNREIQSVYSDARAEYTKQLCVFLVPAYFTFYVDLLEQCKKTQEPRRVLWHFQTLLNEIHDWNMEKVKHEIQVIQNNCGCDYLEDLLTAVCIAHTKVLTAIRLSSHRSKVEITVPKVDHFLFKALCETAKLLWSNTYLFRDGISSMEKQQNYRAVEGMLNEGILQAIRSAVPVKSILKDFMGDQTAAEDSDEEESAAAEFAATPAAAAEFAATPAAAAVAPMEPIAPMEPMPAPVDLTPAPMEPVPATVDLAPAPMEPMPAPMEPVPAPVDLAPMEPMPAPIAPVEVPVAAPMEPPSAPADPPIIMIDEKPNVRFGSFNAMFDEVGDDSDMVYDSKEDDPVPVLEVLEDDPVPLGDDDFDTMDGPQAMDAGDYEEL
jgi:hypothetical protein